MTLNKRTILLYCLAAALPAMGMALVFNVALMFDDVYLFGSNLQLLGYMIQSEFLVAACGILLILPLLVEIRRWWLRCLRLLAFIVCAFVLAWIAHDLGGLDGMLSYALLVFVTYGGGTLFVFDWLAPMTRTFLSLLRWSMGIFLYVSFQLYFDLDSDISTWRDTPAVIPFGATFFYTIFALEVLLYPMLTWYLENRPIIERRAVLYGDAGNGAQGGERS